MEKRLDKLEDKIDSLIEKVGDVNIHIAEIKLDLKEHMSRSFANEEANKLTNEALTVYKKETDIKVQKFEAVLDRASFLFSVVTALGGVLIFLDKMGIIDYLFHLHR